MHIIQLLGSLMGLSFVAGINLYATVLAVGLGIRLEMIHLAPDLAALEILAHDYVLIAAGIAYAAEFFAVATECFFEKPRSLERHRPALYAELRRFYRRDPAALARGEPERLEEG